MLNFICNLLKSSSLCFLVKIFFHTHNPCPHVEETRFNKLLYSKCFNTGRICLNFYGVVEHLITHHFKSGFPSDIRVLIKFF